MNSLLLAPLREHTADRYLAGALQLSDGTSVILDQTVVGRGYMGRKASGNLLAIRKVASEAVLCCDCGFGTSVELPVDLPMVMVSGPRGLLHESFTVVALSEVAKAQVAKESEAGSPVPPSPPAEVLRRVREYLAIARCLPYHVSEEVNEKIREGMVAIRKADRSVEAEDLHRLMTLTRLVSASLGEDRVSEEAWKRANAMERARRGRLPKHVQKQMQEASAKAAKAAHAAEEARKAIAARGGADGAATGGEGVMQAMAGDAESGSGPSMYGLSAAEQALLRSVAEARPTAEAGRAAAGRSGDDTDEEDDAFASAATPRGGARAAAGAGAGLSVGRGGAGAGSGPSATGGRAGAEMGRNLTPEEAYRMGRERRRARNMSSGAEGSGGGSSGMVRGGPAGSVST